ncbi:MAG: recombination mediator RecR [Hyphomicrobiales bacterium]
MKDYSSILIEQAVEQISRFPGIGKKTALRLSLWLLKQKPEIAEAIGKAIIKLREDIKYCEICHNISESNLCDICANPKRDTETICVVEDTRDVISIENTKQFFGLYHVLGGIINPMEGVSPSDIRLESLINKVSESNIKEIVIALPTTVEGDTTSYYIYKQIREKVEKVTTIARGISVGDELEYTDEITLGRSIINRIPYQAK